MATDPALTHQLMLNTNQLRSANQLAKDANRIAAANLLVALGEPVPTDLLDKIKATLNG